jgi:hypothetical protein
MKIKLLYVLAAVLLLGACNYRLYLVTDENWHKHWVRGYKSYRLEHKYFDKQTVKYRYKPAEYARDITCVAKTDTSIDCDSIKLYIQPDSRQFSSIFTLGIVSCKLLNSCYGPAANITNLTADQDRQFTDTAVKVWSVFDMHRLRYVRKHRGRRIYKFQILPYWFYMELTNKAAPKKCSNEAFIAGAKLTWLYRANIIGL